MLNSTPPRKLRLPLAAPADRQQPRLPAVLRSLVSRGADGEAVNLLDDVEVLATYELAGASRSAEAPESLAEELGEALLALEAEDGSTVFIRADRLLEDIRRLCPEAVDGEEIDLARFRERDATSRGAVGAWLWRRLSVLKLGEDDILTEAETQAKEWLGEKLAEKLGKEALLSASWLGAKALMAAIESHLAGEPGLYQWNGAPLSEGDLCREGDARFQGWEREPGLIFIHGTASHTLGGFGDLPGGQDWTTLQHTFGERIFGFEHRTFSESPIDNALALVKVLPDKARVSLVTHSRGGLVGDLLCLAANAGTRNLIDDFRRKPRPDEVEQELENPELATLREQVAKGEREKLVELLDLLASKALRIERYVRVACPAGGTALLSDNLEVFLSGLLNLARRLGTWGAGAAVSALATPVAGKVAANVADQALKLLSRVVLEIADKRLQPQVVPGIEAMLPEAPLGGFLARASRLPDTRMAVIAGDIEGGGMIERIGVLFTDWMFFDLADNDLVVDTPSMYQGLATGNGAYALLDQGAAVNHFSYFRNPRTRGALSDWLLDERPAALKGWSELPAPRSQAREAVSRGAAEPPANDTRPVVIFLPGIMGSHLEIDRKDAKKPGSGDRVWLDPVDLPRGGLSKIARKALGVEPEDLLDLAYGDLARYLEGSHRVIRFPYDWRLEIAKSADKLAGVLRQVLADHPSQPVRLLAHSMGGLVVRAMIANEPGLWEQVVKRPGGRLLMLGTPNQGSHLMVETLLGKSDTIRTLGRVDLAHSLQEVLDIVAAFPGTLHLLPRPGFLDVAGPAARDYYQASTWSGLKPDNNDFWFGKKLGGEPGQVDLNTAREFWEKLGDPVAEKRRIGNPDQVAYVFGQADNTPCGLRAEGGRIEMLGTSQGDGSVTWASGRLDWLPDSRCWTMPADHMGLTSTSGHFDAIVELLATGSTSRLGRLPVSRGDAVPPVRAYQPGPMPGFPSEAELVTRLVGGHSRVPRARAPRQTLAVGVKAMDLRFTQHPILCGHYLGDPISGPEAAIDECLVGGALSQRQRLGVHAGALGSTSVVLMPRGHEDILRGAGRGAVVVGLGEMGDLSSREISETVRAGVLRLLLHIDDRGREEDENPPHGPGEKREDTSAPSLQLASLLIGYNSTINISLEESVRAITLGVLEANHQFAQGPAGGRGRQGKREPAQVARLEFIEVYRDAAITAAHAVRDLPTILERELARLEMCVEPEEELEYGDGARPRLSLQASSSYWPRLMVTDADAGTTRRGAERQEPGDTPADSARPAPTRHAARLKYVYLGQRARAETVVRQRQPGLVESLVKDVVGNTRYAPGGGIGNTLFHLLVPLDFKAAARETPNLVPTLDPATANIPWEMLEMDGEPLVRSTRLVRQLASPAYRQHARSTRDLSAFLVANPSTLGYHAQFAPNWKPKEKLNGEIEEDRLPSLSGSVEEAKTVRDVLARNGYQITESLPDCEAGDVFGKLFAHPYRILVISAHGVYQVRDGDGIQRSGVVLSDGLLLTADEVSMMETVPELVFLNGCHLGKMSDEDREAARSHRLAYSLAREFIEMGVRCVVASGWEVDDEAGRTFAETFFDLMVSQAASFGHAIHEARLKTFDRHPGINTWGAYQAYGDPDFRLEIRPGQEDGDGPLLAPDELLDWLERRRLAASHGLDGNGLKPAQRFQAMERALDRRLRKVPAAWLERPEIQQALGLLYGAYAAEGYEKARAALARAIAEEVKRGMVGIASIEQLANFEARQATRLGREAGRREDALKLVEGAIDHLRELIRITHPDPSTTTRPNTERQSLLGSALKRRAALLLGDGKGWDELEPVLSEASKAYRAGEQHPGAAGFNPYATINRLHLDAVLGKSEPDLANLVAQCQSAARRRFAESYDFFDGVMAADAALVPLLYPDAPLDALAGMAQVYQDAVKQLSSGARKFDSVVSQFCLLAGFIQARGVAMKHKGDGDRARALADLARRLDPDAAPCELKSEPVETSAPPEGSSEPTKPGATIGTRGRRKRGGI